MLSNVWSRDFMVLLFILWVLMRCEWVKMKSQEHAGVGNEKIIPVIVRWFTSSNKVTKNKQTKQTNKQNKQTKQTNKTKQANKNGEQATMKQNLTVHKQLAINIGKMFLCFHPLKFALWHSSYKHSLGLDPNAFTSDEFQDFQWLTNITVYRRLPLIHRSFLVKFCTRLV